MYSHGLNALSHGRVGGLKVVAAVQLGNDAQCRTIFMITAGIPSLGHTKCREREEVAGGRPISVPMGNLLRATASERGGVSAAELM